MKRETLNPEQAPKTRNKDRLILWLEKQATEGVAIKTSDKLLPRGLRRHRATDSEHERTRLAITFLGGI